MNNRNKKQKNKYELRRNRNRVLAGVLAAVLIIALLLGAILPGFVEGAELESLEISGEVGFSRRYKLYGETPVRLSVENNGSDFKGELQIRVNYSTDPNIAREIIYAYPFELPGGSIRDITMEIEIPIIRTSIKVSCVNESGKSVLESELDTIALEPSGILIGALSDDRNSLNYFRQMQLDIASSSPNKAVSDNLVFLDETNMPDNLQIMNNFNFFIINNYDTGRLTEKQINIISEWVEAGGVLILGGGPNYQKVFKTLGSFIETDSKGQHRIDRLSGETLDTSIIIERISTKDGASVLTSGGEALVSLLKIGNGAVLVHSFDLGIAPVPELSRETSFLEQIYLQYAMNTITFLDTSSHYYNSYYGSNIQLVDRGRIIAIFTVIGIYCIVIGPILYTLLKKADKREKAVIVLPALSLSAVVVIGAISFGSSYRKPLSSSNSLIAIDSGGSTGDIESMAYVYSPSKGDVKVDFDKTVSLMPSYDTGYYYYSSFGYASNTSRTVSDRKITFGDKTSLTFYENGKWDQNQYKIADKVSLDGSIICDFTIEGDNLVGKITNTTSLDFCDVIIGFANDYKRYDFLEANSVLEIVQPFPTNAYIYGWPQPAQVYQASDIFYEDMSTSQRQKIRQRENILNYYVNNRSEIRYKYSGYSTSSIQYLSSSYAYSVSSSVPSVQVIGGSNSINGNLFDVSVFCFNYDNLNTYDVLINGRQPTDFNLNLFDIKSTITLNPGSFIKIPQGMVSAYVDGGDASFDYSDSTGIHITRGGEVIIKFDTPDNIEPSAFSIHWDTLVNSPELSETVSIYNNLTDKWDEISFTQISAETLSYSSNTDSGYIDSNGIIEISVHIPVSTYFRLPGFSVEGTLKGSEADA